MVLVTTLVWLLSQHLTSFKSTYSRSLYPTPSCYLYNLSQDIQFIVLLTSHTAQTCQPTIGEGHAQLTRLVIKSLVHIKSLALRDSRMDLLPKYKPLERRLFRFIVMQCFLHSHSKNWKSSNWRSSLLKVLYWLWCDCIVALRESIFPIKAYIRPTKLESLKIQLTDMVTLAQFQIEFQAWLLNYKQQWHLFVI